MVVLVPRVRVMRVVRVVGNNDDVIRFRRNLNYCWN